MRLPARVASRVRAQEVASEILVGWIQLAVVRGFSIVYFLARKTFSPNALVPPGAVGARRVPRIHAAAPDACLPQQPVEWMRYLSIVIDMSLLIGLIWSFHLQYMQPPSFYLKAPTVLYIFIFIALRTLNFDALKVMTAGLVAILGWLLLVAYVITIDPHDAMITHDYVHYLTSNSVLIGAEVDKIISIGVVTAILAYAIARNRRLLTLAVTESATNQDLARFVPTEVATLIKTSDDGVQLGFGEPREATVLFLDLEGFTTLSERLPPDELVRTLNMFYAAWPSRWVGTTASSTSSRATQSSRRSTPRASTTITRRTRFARRSRSRQCSARGLLATGSCCGRASASTPAL
jgi:adenylate cyclase